MSTTAQEEVDRLFSQRESHSTHPEDARYHSDSSEHQNPLDNEKQPHDSPSDLSDNDDDDAKPRGRGQFKMTTTTTTQTSYHLPTTIFDANTGPKGVIADAQSFDRAKKRSFRRTLLAFSNSASNLQFGSKSKADPSKVEKENLGSSPENSDDEEFMRQWRENRIQELQTNSQQRRSSPSKRRYGTFDDVDANGYLDAVERVPPETVVVVCIYDPESIPSHQVESALSDLARLHPATRFVKLHHEIAEMEHVGSPAILAYKGGDVFATLVDIEKSIPSSKSMNSLSLEDLMRTHKMLS